MILATTKVEDIDRFLEVFASKGAVKRAEHGSKGSTVFRDPSEEDRKTYDFRTAILWEKRGTLAEAEGRKADAVASYLKKHPVVTAATDGRVTIRSR